MMVRNQKKYEFCDPATYHTASKAFPEEIYKRKSQVLDDNHIVHLRNHLLNGMDHLPKYVDAHEKRTSLTPAEHSTLSWHNINVYLNLKHDSSITNCWKKQKGATTEKRKHILKNVSGVVHPGELLAIMGSSGAGKTTLMNVLTNRNRNQMDVEGEVRVNGRIVDKSFAQRCSYVQQDDLFIGNLTVREHLTFHAMLRMDQEMRTSERLKKLDDALRELGLKKCEHSRIGFPGISGSISGGERKRLAFACEMLTNPSVMFCDEPTSGLDSFMAQSVVSVLSKLAQGGRTVICTVHQPSSEIYAMFHNVLFMAEGRVAYMGKAEGAIAFFEKVGYRVPINYNPSDFFVHTLAIIPGDELESRKRVQFICDEFAKQNPRLSINASPKESVGNHQSLKRDTNFTFKASVIQQMMALLWRASLVSARDRRATWTRIALSISISGILGAIFWQQKLDQKGLMNINGVIFLSLVNLSYTSMMPPITSIAAESAIFFREHKNGMYRTSLYFLCKTLAEIPVNMIVSFCFVTISYWMIGFHNYHENISNYFIYLIIMILVTNAANSFGQLITYATNSLEMALGVASPATFCFVAFGGFFINPSAVQPYLRWIKYLSWIYYADQALVINQWQEISNISCSTAEESICIRNGKYVMKMFDFEEEKFLECIEMLVLLLVVFKIVSLTCLLIKANVRR